MGDGRDDLETADAAPGMIAGATSNWKGTAAAFDVLHSVIARSELMTRLAAEAFGEDYPAEVHPFGGTTWWILGRAICGLRVGPGHVLVDLACGCGEPGLWLSRATGAALVGVDWSPAAVRIATGRAARFVPSGQARFVVGDLSASGMEDDAADAVVCLDAVFFARDRIAALSEVRRILRPGGRYVFTAGERLQADLPGDVTDWAPLLAAAGLELESREVIPHANERWLAMYGGWLANLHAIREDLGPHVAGLLEREARAATSESLAAKRFCLIIARRPERVVV